MNRRDRRRAAMLLNPEIAGALLGDRIADALDRFGQEMPASASEQVPTLLADVIAELTRRNPYLMRLIFENPVVREAYERNSAAKTT